MQIKKSPPSPELSHCFIKLNKGFYAKVSPEDFLLVSRYRWFVVQSSHRFYAVRCYTCGGRRHYIKLHHFIAHTPKGMECHHKDHDTFNDTRENLVNLTPSEHRQAHYKSR